MLLEQDFPCLQQRRQPILSTERENDPEKTVEFWKIGIFFYDKTLLELANLGVERACCLGIILTNAYQSFKEGNMMQVIDCNYSECLRDQVMAFSVDPAASIPWIVRLLENSQSPLALPGDISLFNHDCLHILLGRDRSQESEAYVIGFTMGNDTKCQRIHLWIFKIFALLFYPQKYRLRWSDLKEFDRGVADGRHLEVKNLNQIDFSDLQDYSVKDLREKFQLSFLIE